MPGVAADGQRPRSTSQAVLARRDDFTHNRDDSSQVEWATAPASPSYAAAAGSPASGRCEVTAADGTTRTLTARQAVVLATGTTATVPDRPGLRDAKPWISRDVTNLREVPRRVVVIGGGVVACESATWLRGLGAEEVTIVERGDAAAGQPRAVRRRAVAESFERARASRC